MGTLEELYAGDDWQAEKARAAAAARRAQKTTGVVEVQRGRMAVAA